MASDFGWDSVEETTEPGGDAWQSNPDRDPERPGSSVRWITLAAVAGAVAALLFVAFLVIRSGGNGGKEDLVVQTTARLSTTSSTDTTTAGASSGAEGLIDSVSITVVTAPVPCVSPASNVANPLETFVNVALAQQGDAYEFAANADPTDPDPDVFDTSELVEWSAAQAGVTIVDGSWLQYLDLVACGTEISIAEALASPGALVFGFSTEPTADKRPDESFVAISLGDGQRIIDVRSGLGVGVFDATDRKLTHAAYIPDLGTGVRG